MLKHIARQLSHLVTMRQQIGGRQYLKYLRARSGQEVVLKINGHHVTVRRGTPDLDVALSCLSGEFDMCRYLLPKDYAGVIVDAGGYIGAATLALRDMFPKARIIVVEPSEDNLRILRKNLAEMPDLEIVHGALVGEATDRITLRDRQSGAWGYTVVEAPDDGGTLATVGSVPGRTLGQLVDNVSDIGFLKLDIEGGEVGILQQDRASLEKIGIIFAELHERIVPGCEALFFAFSEERILIEGSGEKFLSIRR